MQTCIFRFGIAAMLGAAFCSCFAQSESMPTAPPASDYQVYSTLFREVLLPLKPAAQKPASALPPIHDSAGLTDREIGIIRPIAADCQQRLSLVGSDHPQFDWWEAIMESIETGEDQAAKIQQMMRDDEAQRERITLAHEQLLKAALGDERFQQLDVSLREALARRPKRR